MAQEVQKITDTNEEQSKWVHNSSVDHKGNFPARASTGAWKAAIFIITIEFSERVAFFAIAMNLISYLTKVLHQDLKTAAKNVSYWTGATTMLPLVGAFLADAYLGRFFMIMLSSAIYLMGLILLTLSEFLPIFKPSTSVHEVVFFVGLYLLSLGAGGHKPNLESFGADQFDDDHFEERMQKMSFFNWWNVVLGAGILIGTTLIVYVEDHMGWGVSSSILLLLMAISVLLFFLGKSFYRYKVPQGSPLMPIFRVFVAALSKRNLPQPSNPDMLYEVPQSKNIRGRLLCHTNSLRFLDKAAIVENDDIHQTSWRVATVTMVEETKLIINMIPIWSTSVMFGICLSQGSTFFVKQASTMNRKIGNNFEIPPASVGNVGTVAMVVAIAMYEKILNPVLQRVRGQERGLKILQRIGIGMIFPVLVMAVAAIVERKRLGMAGEEFRRGNFSGHSLPMSVLWVTPQYILLGIGDSFAFVGLQEYFYEQVPDSMRSLGIAFFLSAIGVGSFLSGFFITIIGNITGKLGTSWFGKDVNSSRLDKFYMFLTVLGCVNFCAYVFFAKRFLYKSVKKENKTSDGNTV